MAFACSINDYAAASRVYDRFLLVLEPGQDLLPIFLLTLYKRKTGSETAPCAVEIMQELSDDMQAAIDKQDIAACERICDRFLTEDKKGVVSRFKLEHTRDTPEARQAKAEDWTRPRPTPSRM